MSNGLAQAVATQTKTKVNIQQTALVGIAAVATAALLGAFTANFAIVASGGVRIAATTAITPVAYFRFTDGGTSTDTYIIKLTDQVKIDQARAILAGQVTGAIHVMGKVVKQPAEFNPVWHTYLDPASIVFFQVAAEVCDATIRDVEVHYDNIGVTCAGNAWCPPGGTFLPGNSWCPWGSRLTEEVAYPSANNLALNKPARNFLRDYTGTAKWTVTDEYNYKTSAEARGYTASKLTDGRWISLSSLAYGANIKYGFEIDLQQPTLIKSLKLYWGHFGESPAIHESSDRNNKYFMQDYHVYAFTNNQWVQIAGKSLAPAERLTTVDLATATTTSKLRITSGVDANGNWTKGAKNWTGVYEVEVYGPPTLNVAKDASTTDRDIPNDVVQVVLGGFDLTVGQEPILITQLPFFLKVKPIEVTPGTFENIGTNDITNVWIYNEQNQIVQESPHGTVINLPDGSREFSFPGTSPMLIPVGVHHYTVKADISALVSKGTTIRAALKPSLIIGRGQTTNQSVTPSPSTEVLSALMTVNFCSVVHIGNYSYHLEPCNLDIQMHDGGNAKPFSTRIIQEGGSASYGYVVYGYGTGFPTYGILGDGSGGATGNRTIAEYFNDNVLSAAGNLPRVYQGYLPIRVDQNGVVKELRLTLKLTVLPPVCGDHNTDVGEFCDYGNTSNGDGCSATCQIEPGTTVCPRLNASNINPAIYYRLEPCSFDITFIDGQGDQLLDYTLIQEGGLMKFWYNVNGQVGMPSGYGTPVPAIGSVTSGSQLFTALLSDTYLNVTAPQTYEGYVPAKINFDNGNQTSTQLRLNVKIKALPASAAQPALKMTFDPVVPAQNVVAGSKNQIFAYVKLDASNSSENISVTQIQARVASVSPASPSQTSNWSIFEGQTELATLNDPDWSTSSQTATGTSATTTFTFNAPLTIATSTARTLTIKADVATAATAGGVMVGCQPTVTTDCVRAKGVSGTDATVTITPFAGNLQTFLAGGALTITVDASTPVARLISANTLGVTLASLKVAAQFEAVQIDKFYLTGEQVNNGGWDQVKKLYVYKGSTLLTEVTPTATDGVNRTVLVDLTNVRIDDRIVPKDGSIVLIFKADTPDVNYENSTNAVSGQGIRLKINGSNDVTARGAQSGTALFASVTAAAGNPQYLFRGMPQVGSMGKICAYGADGAGDIGLYSANGALEVVQAGSCSSIHTRSEFVSTNTPPNPLPDTVPHLQISGSQGLYWTDFWRTPTLQFASSTSTTTEQWMNGYLVPPQL